jgi:CheY-like chemotaxis protein
MKLQFGLLWIEDNYSRNEEAEIRAGAAGSGFELEITVSEDGSDLESLAARQRKFHVFDLVLLDLKLAGGVQGDALAPQVRNLFRFTPILFYSGSDSEAGLRDRMAKDKIEGVFCAQRNNFTIRASELIQDYAHTLNRLAGMRGLAMEVVAEVDVICRDIISKIAIDRLEVVATDLLDKAVCDQSQKNLDEFPSLADLNERMLHPATDSMKSFNVFRALLKTSIKNLPDGANKDRLRALSVATKDYRKQVIEVRNVLGHALETENEKGWLILDRDGEPFMTISDFPRHRSNFLQNLRAIRDISDVLIPK